MNIMLRSSHIYVILLLIFMVLSLSGCGLATITPYPADSVERMALATSGSIPESCEFCAQATLAALMTQEKNNADFQAASTADILRANAQATVNSANATLNAAQTQEENNTNIIAAQLAATAEIVRANAQATLASAGSTQIAAMTQGQYNLQVTESARTQESAALLIQQNKNDLSAGTQTAVANNIATQTQSAAATSQWYADQERQRNEERQGPISFMWTWCLPIFLVLLAGLILWGGRRWLSIQQTNQRILAQPAEKLPEPVVVRQHRRDDDRLPYIETDVLDDGYQVTTPHDQVSDWLDEVKDELQSSDEKDKDDDQGN